MGKSKGIPLTLLGKEYHVTCSAGYEGDLQAASQLLDKKMQEVRLSARVHSLEHIAIMAGLSLAFDYLQNHKKNDRSLDALFEVIEHINAKMDKAFETAALI